MDLQIQQQHLLQVQVDQAEGEGNVPKVKQRGRNQNRPPPMKFDRKDNLCPVLIDVSPEREVFPECQTAGCQFKHDVKDYLDQKPTDIGSECHVYNVVGDSFRNVVNRDVFKPDWNPVKNHLSKSVQISLRKKTYDFSRCDAQVEVCFKQRAEAGQPEQEEPEEKRSRLHVDHEAEGMKLGVGDPPAICMKRIDWKDKIYLAPLTTVGNLPFRRICKEFGADITCGEMAMSAQLLQGHQPEWALVQRHSSEDLFGIQLCGSSPQQMCRVAQLVEDGHIDCDFVDINLGCPIDLVYRRGMGSGLMCRKKPLEIMVRSMASVLHRPLTVKMRSGIQIDKQLAHTLIPNLKTWGASMLTVHGRSREQRYTRLADWSYIHKCCQICQPLPMFGNGDVNNFEDYLSFKQQFQVDGIMVARGALIKPWLFQEIKEQRHWDISATERLDLIKKYCHYGLEHWGSDSKGVETTRRFLLEWLSFLHRYVPHGILVQPPQRMNQRIPAFQGRNDLETLLSSPTSTDWIKISEMFLGKVPQGFIFQPKHRANGF